MTVTEFFEKNIDKLNSVSSVSEVEKIAINLAKEQNVPEVLQLAEDHLLIAKLTGFLGWCGATPESMDDAIKTIENGLCKVPDWGYKRSLHDFMNDVSFALSHNLPNMPYAAWEDICKHFYNS